MPSPTRFLQSSSAQFSADDPSASLTMDSDVVVVLASLVCALICIAGLALTVRCAWLRRHGAQPPSPRPAAVRGIKKKVLNSLPKTSFSVESAALSTDCAICLAEFEDGEQIRVLPPCGHGFHVGCIDTWLGSHSSCPSCRQVLVVAAAASSTCHKCGVTAVSAANSGGSSFLP